MFIEFYTDKAGEHRWRVVASNGKIVADSGEGYINFSDCTDMARKLFTAKDWGWPDIDLPAHAVIARRRSVT
jgi:hypothetical protein